MKSITVRRIFSYFTDIIIINLLVSIFTMFIPVSDNYEKLNNELLSINNQYFAKEIDESAYLTLVYDTEYDLKKETIPISIISVVVSLLYFVVLPFYNNGKTVGKMLNHIKIVKSNNTDITMNDYVLRSFINNSIFISLIELLLIFTINSSKIMVVTSVVLTYINLIVLFISLIMIIFSKKKVGIHDIICKTEVVEG